jgi:hypothetical protein
LFNLHEVSNIKETEIPTAEPLVNGPSVVEVEVAIYKIKGHKSPNIDQMPAELIKAVGKKFRYEITKLENSVWNKEDLTGAWKESIIVTFRKKEDKTDCSNYRGISL